jgi:hypothetical protein
MGSLALRRIIDSDMCWVDVGSVELTSHSSTPKAIRVSHMVFFFFFFFDTNGCHEDSRLVSGHAYCLLHKYVPAHCSTLLC